MSASPYHLGKERVRYDMLRAVAQAHGVPVVYCNLVGGNDELIFDGNSLAFDASAISLPRASRFRRTLSSWISAGRTPAPPQRFDLRSAARLHDALVLGLRDYTRKCGFKSVVLGLSGGIDSAVTACLAVAALGPENVMGVSMPSQFSSKGSIDDARVLARNLGIRWETIPIQERIRRVQGHVAERSSRPVPKTRLRKTSRRVSVARLLMALSNKFGHMLLTTGNKSEMAVGYCTLYGDMNGGLGVIADVPKTMVYELARYHQPESAVNGRGRGKSEAGRGVGIAGFPNPETSLTKPPSAELRPNQTDQDTLPPYERPRRDYQAVHRRGEVHRRNHRRDGIR